MAEPTTPDNLPQVLGEARGQIDDFAFAVNQQFDLIDENIRSLMGAFSELSVKISTAADQVDKNFGLVVRSTADSMRDITESMRAFGDLFGGSAGGSGGQSDLATGLQTFGLAATGMSVMSTGLATPFLGPIIVGFSTLAAVLAVVATRMQESGDEISGGLDQAFSQDMAKIIDEQIKALDGLIEGWRKTSDELVGNSIVPDMVTSIGEWFGKLDPLMVKPVQEMGGQVENAFRGMGDNVSRSIGNMVKQGKISFDSLRGAARSLVQDLQSMLIDRLIVSPFRTGLGSFLDAIFKRASGGDVTGGMPFMVGEQGPELFVPKTSGVIRPTNESKGSSRPDVHFHVDMRGASLEAVRRLELFVRQINGSIEMRAIAAVYDDMARRP